MNDILRLWYCLNRSVLLLSFCYFILRMPVSSIRGNVHYSVNQKKEIFALLAGVTHRGYLLCLACPK